MNVTRLMCFLNYNKSQNSLTGVSSHKTDKKKLIIINNVIFVLILPGLKHLTNISTQKTKVFQILLLLFSMAFPQASSTSFHNNVKYGTNTIKTKYGLLRGIMVRSSPAVEAYLGIPYASPPTGSLRFMPPITPSSWKNVRNADRFSPVCPQTVPMPPNGPEALLEVPRARLVQFRRLLPLLRNQSEDCLYLNIYAPKISPTAQNNQQGHHESEHNTTTIYGSASWIGNKLSTILFIHGESYEWNSGNPYDGSELAAHGNVIVVTINFRLGILGFLKTGGKESAQGNFGLMDLVAGLHWLRENLPAFGGASDQITVMGHGTGAALANILLVSPVSSDLIQRAVLISGSALSPWAIQRSPLFVKRRVAEQTGCHGDLLYDDLAPCLRTKKLSELLAVRIDYPRFLNGFAPFVDGTVIASNTDAIGALKLPLGSAIVSTSGIEFANFPKQDLIFGLTSVESYLDLSAQDLEFGLNETRKDRILRTYVRNVFHYHLNEIFAVLKNEYTDWEKSIRNPFSCRDATLSYLSDGHTASPLIKIGYMHSLRGGKNYFLHFKHRTEEEEYPSRSGSVRGEDVPFWFGLPVSPLFPQNYSTAERRLSLMLVNYLSSFVKTGNPNQYSKSTQKDDRKKETYIRGFADSSYEKLSNGRNNTENNLTLPKEKRRVAQYFTSLDTDLSNGQLALTRRRPKRSTIQMGPTKLKRSMSISSTQGINGRLYSNTHRKRISLEDLLNDAPQKDTLVRDELPYWDPYDSSNQLYLELGSKAEIRSHYRGHKLSMWLNLIPQLHKHLNLNEVSMRHHHLQEEGVNFYDGIVRPHLQTTPIDINQDTSFETRKAKSAIIAVPVYPKHLSPDAVTTDCSVNVTQLPSLVSPYAFANSSNISDSLPNVLENMDVLRRLSGKQLQSYTTALIATVAVGCFLLILNVLIFAGIYHQREKRVNDTRKKEQLEENEIFLNRTPTKGLLNVTYIQTASDKVSFSEYNCIDQKTTQLVEKDLPLDNDEIKIKSDSDWVCCSNTVDLLNIKCNQEDVIKNDCFLSNKADITLFEPVEAHEMPYQDMDDFMIEKTAERTIDTSTIQPPFTPKAVPLNHSGILRISGTNQMQSANKKRVHIQEISV